jgi:hypothetical protein
MSLYEPHEKAAIKDSLDNYLSIRTDEELYSLLLMDPEYRNLQKKNSEITVKIKRMLPDEYKTLEETEIEIESMTNRFYYLQGIQDGLKLKNLFGDTKKGAVL